MLGRKWLLGVSSVVAAAGVLGLVLGVIVGSAAGQASSAKAAVIKVTAGDPTEYAFKLSKSSVTWSGKAASLVVTFAVDNDAALYHDFRVCSAPVTNSKLNTCKGAGTKVLAPGSSATLVVTFKKKGQYEFLSTQKGDAAAGMKGVIGVGVAVKPTGTGTPTTTTSTSKTTTTPSGGGGTTTTGTAALIGDPVAGAAVFSANGCGSCHTLAAAGTSGTIGPNLNLAKPDQNTVKLFVQNGGGGGGNVMPPFTLSATDLNNLAAYVYKSTH